MVRGVFADWQANRGLTGREQWDPMFAIYVGVLVTGSLCWMLYRKRSIDVSVTL